MPGKVALQVVKGPMKGVQYHFDSHETFWFGRSKNCNLCLPEDPEVSRYHFFLEVNPPEVLIRDLGSLNGTYINGEKFGSRTAGETPEQGATRRYPEIYLKDGDIVEVGLTAMVIRIKDECQLGKGEPTIKLSRDSVRHRKRSSRETVFSSPGEMALPVLPLNCLACNNEVSSEIRGTLRGDYICTTCRNKLTESEDLREIRALLKLDQERRGEEEVPRLSQYVMVKKAGNGHFGAVYLARRKSDVKRVAIKTMFSQIPVSETARKSYLREVVLTTIMVHPNLVTLMDYGAEGGVFYIVMELCEGGNIRHLVPSSGGKMDIAQASPLMFQALAGLEFIHEKKAVHRDLKPSNMLIAKKKNQDILKISDVGVIRNFFNAGFGGMVEHDQIREAHQFMARERLMDFQFAMPVTDVWSMAAIFYYMLTGVAPRHEEGAPLSLDGILKADVVPSRERNPDIPDKVADVIDRCLTDDLGKRYESAKEMRAAFRKVL